jgi:DNA polymerase-3 subunit epsilon
VVVGDVAARGVAAGAASPPATIGLYAFRDAAGALLYVGSSRDLARRVRSYFAPHHPPASKPARIARLAATVGWQACGSLLEALVLEARTIQRERPHFNRRLKQTGAYAYVRLDPRDAFPRLEVTRRLDDGPWRYVGPFPGGRRLAGAVALLADGLGLRTCPGRLHPDPAARACLRLDLGLCTAPCVGRTTAGGYGRQLPRALAALGGGDPDAARAAGARADAGPTELPAAVRGAIAALRRARQATRVVAVVPATGAPGHRLLALGGGRLRAAIPATRARELAAAFAEALAALAPPPPSLIAPEDLDEVRIVTAWLASPAGRAAAVDVGRLGRAAGLARVRERATTGPLFA